MREHEMLDRGVVALVAAGVEDQVTAAAIFLPRGHFGGAFAGGLIGGDIVGGGIGAAGGDAAGSRRRRPNDGAMDRPRITGQIDAGAGTP